MRTTTISRKTAETDVYLTLNLDGNGISVIETGCGFLNHMLTLFSAHGRFDLNVKCAGDVEVDYHHTAEDIGICLGLAFRDALGEKKGINRYGNKIIPMDESLVLSAADISGRGMLVCDLDIPTEKVGDFDTELVEEFFTAFTRESGITLHIKQLAGYNSHHIIECVFKSVSRSLSEAVIINKSREGEIPSTKGVL